MADIVLVSADAVSPSLDAFLSFLLGGEAPIPHAVLHGIGYSGCQGIDVHEIAAGSETKKVRLNVVRPSLLVPYRLYARATAVIGFIEPGAAFEPLAARMNAVWAHKRVPGVVVCMAPPVTAAETYVSSPEDARRVVTNLLSAADSNGDIAA